MSEEEGYYWISLDGSEPLVALLSTAGYWLTPGDEHFHDESDVEVLSEKLDPPE